MQMFMLALIFYFIIGAGVCLLICVNPNDPGLLGRASNLLFKKLPVIVNGFVGRIFGQRGLSCLTGCKGYLLQSNHPIVQIFYLLIAVVGFMAYQWLGIFKHMPNRYVSDWHIIIANVLAFFCFYVYYKACSVSPGEITKQNQKDYIKRFESYYDSVIYKQKNKCKTCLLVKPARSKHCSICKMCVSRFDHHCVWIRQCVGQKNYKHFISFLFLHSVWCLYLSVIGALSLLQAINRMGFMKMSFKMNGGIVPATPMLAVQYLFMTQTVFFFLIIMCLIMGVTLLLFVTYHFYLISKGQTTNQRVKINDQIDYLKKEIKNVNNIQKQKQSCKKQDKQKPIQYRKQKVPLSQLIQYKAQCSRRLAILEKKRENKGFIHNLRQIYAA